MSVTTLSESTPVARKVHGCGACLGRIGVGDRYERQCNVDNGEMWTWKAHLLCRAVYLANWEPYDEEVDPDSVHHGLLRIFAVLAGSSGGDPQ